MKLPLKQWQQNLKTNGQRIAVWVGLSILGLVLACLVGRGFYFVVEVWGWREALQSTAAALVIPFVLFFLGHDHDR